MKMLCAATCLLAWTFGLTSCTPAVLPPPVLTPITVQLVWTHQAQFAGMYTADQKGYYQDAGFRVKFLEGGAEVDKLAPVLDGTAQFGVGGADELILARSQGKPLKAIATIYRRSPIVFVSLADKGITRPQDFAGKTIRVAANVASTLNAMMARLGIPPDQYTTVVLPSDLSMFAGGEVPVWGIYSNSFLVTIEQAGHQVNKIYPDDYRVHFYADTLFTTDEMIATHPEWVQRFLDATLKGWTYAVENVSEAPGLVLEYDPGADAAIEKLRMVAGVPLVKTGEDHIGWMKAEVWTDMERTLREQGVLDKPVDVTQVYTLRFLNELYGK